MARERFKKQQLGTFFGTFICDRIVPEGHFLRNLDSIIGWDVFTKQLIEYYDGGAMDGRPPYDPAVLLKMLLICYLCPCPLFLFVEEDILTWEKQDITTLG